MTIWANAAICAVNIIKDQNLSPEEAWFEAISKYTKSYKTCIKGCPKNVFVDLYYHKKLKLDKPIHDRQGLTLNGRYALKAIELLIKDSSLANSKNELWTRTMQELNDNPYKGQNGQMDIVIALFDNNLLNLD
jgi:hypothetical protein